MQGDDVNLLNHFLTEKKCRHEFLPILLNITQQTKTKLTNIAYITVWNLNIDTK